MINHIKTVYSPKQISDPGHDAVDNVISPSAWKPKLLAQLLEKEYPEIEFVQPEPLSVKDLYRCHSKNYVDDIFALKTPNGFRTLSQSVNDSLLYTNGAMYTAAKLAKPNSPTAALVSGFHHAGYDGFGPDDYFCTFNGLVASALKLIEEDGYKRVAIVDCDQHYGNGTQNILNELDRKDIFHSTFGRYYFTPEDAPYYLHDLCPTTGKLVDQLYNFQPDIIIYQAGADVHVDDPFGGILTTEEIYERDVRIFTIARNLQIPIAWNLAGGYQKDINEVLVIHHNTFIAAEEIYGCSP
jgi:acetoin utilization deacetylase AcuC-like enzyme